MHTLGLNKGDPDMPSIDIRETFKTEAEAKAFVDKYMSAYSPLAYGTSLRRWQSDSGCWFVAGHRFSTAD